MTHAAAYKLIRPYVTFPFQTYKKVRGKRKLQPPTKQTKAETVRYYFLLYGGKTKRGEKGGQPGLQSIPRYHLKKKLTRENRKLAEEYARIPKGFGKLKGVLIPVAHDGAKPTIKFKKTKSGKRYLQIGEDNVESNVLSFEEYETEEAQVLEEPERVVRRMLKDDPKGKAYKIVCGKGSTGNSYDRKAIVKEVARFFNDYDDASEWCTGIISHTYRSEKTYEAYKRALAKAKLAKRERVQAIRRGRIKDPIAAKPRKGKKGKRRG